MQGRSGQDAIRDNSPSESTDLSIIVPCHNESDSIPELTRSVHDIMGAELPQVSYELILIDDGSTDKTASAIEDECRRSQCVSGLLFSRNFGKEAAMLAGLREASGDFVLIMDADLQHPVSLIPTLFKTITTQPVEQVIARRDRAGDGVWRTFISRLYYRSVNALVDVTLEDGAGDFRILSRVAVDALLQLNETNRFSKGLFSWIGFPTEVIEYSNVTRKAGKSSWSTRSLVNYGIDGVLAFNAKPLRLVVYLGAATFGLALAYLLFLFVQYVSFGIETPGYLTTIGVITLFGGAELFALGIIGEYVGRLYQESKARPHYLIHRRLGRGPEVE